MTDCPHTIRCAICARTRGPFELHHIALRANSEAAVWLCRPCHDRQSDRQRDAGLITRTPNEAGDALRTLHALTEGLAGILAAHARQAGTRDLAAQSECDRRGTLTLLALASDERPGLRGPRPPSNDRRHHAHPPKRRRRPAPHATAAVSLQALAAVLPALADAIGELLPDDAALPGDLARALACIGRKLAADSNWCAALAALDDHPRAGDLSALVEEARRLWRELVQRTVALLATGGADAHPDTQLTETAREFTQAARRALTVFQALAASENPALALERSLDGRTGEADDSTPGFAA
jgi:hypothetical protein